MSVKAKRRIACIALHEEFFKVTCIGNAAVDLLINARIYAAFAHCKVEVPEFKILHILFRVDLIDTDLHLRSGYCFNSF